LLQWSVYAHYGKHRQYFPGRLCKLRIYKQTIINSCPQASVKLTLLNF
jgi:hypothetical protein